MQSNVTQQRVPIVGDPGPWVHVSESPRHVRVLFGGETIADSKRVKLVRESDVLPAYYFPKEDVRADLFTPSTQKSQCSQKGEASYWTIRSAGKAAENAAWAYLDPLPPASAIKDHFAFEWPKMDQWMEEDEELFKHARDPFNASMRCQVNVMCASSSTARRSPRRAGRISSSRPITPCVTTSLKKTCA